MYIEKYVLCQDFVYLLNFEDEVDIFQFSAIENWDECVGENMGIAKAVGRGEKSAMGPNPVAPGSGSLLSRPAVKHLPVRMSDTLLDCPNCPTPCLNFLFPAIGNTLHPAVKKNRF